jgi:radical SAM protein with 4Fe4S-binding SPASM domain
LEASSLDEISFSLDALTPETYRKIKRSSDFELARNNIIYFLEQRDKRNKWKPFVNLHILKMRETIPEITGFVKQWKPLLKRSDHIIVKELHNFAGQVKNISIQNLIRDEKRFPCRQLWEFLYISWNGDVMPCCMDVLRTLRIGNCRNASIQTLWNDTLLQGLREIHIEGNYDKIPLCSQCSTWWYLGNKPQ